MASDEHREVQVISACEAGHAASTDRLTLGHRVPGLDVEGRKMTVKRLHAHAVVDDHAIAVNAEIARVHDRTGVGCHDRYPARDGEVEAEVHLLIHFRAFIEI